MALFLPPLILYNVPFSKKISLRFAFLAENFYICDYGKC